MNGSINMNWHNINYLKEIVGKFKTKKELAKHLGHKDQETATQWLKRRGYLLTTQLIIKEVENG